MADVGKDIGDLLKQRLSSGAYNDISDPHEFASVLTTDVRSINNDRHLTVRFDPNMIGMMQSIKTEADSLAMIEAQKTDARFDNYGFKEVKILDGNIGYLKLDAFYNVTEEAGATAAAAMNLLSNANALIIDLRENGGGDPSMIQLITSYLYGPERVHLNNFYFRPEEETRQTWTLPYVPGKRRPDVDVYVLTSNYTFSAAEEFSYNLRNLERATLVGEVTGGGAHPGGTRIATDRFTVWVPSGRAVNPISKTNWEGKGVEPHIEVSADKALVTAQIHAMEKQLAEADGKLKLQIEWALEGLQAEQNQVELSNKMLKACVGTYGPRKIIMEDGQLYYQRDGRPKMTLQPMTEDLFMLEELSWFRLKMIREGDKVVGVVGLYKNGQMDKNMRSEEDKTRP